MPMIDIDWLKDHVEVPEGLTYEQLAKDLVKVGLEEEEIHSSQVTGPIVVGYVVDATPEPQKNGKTINWCHVDCGDEWNETDEDGNKVPRGIICGAPNMKAGEKVVVTLPGAVLPGDFKIEPRKTYGHISNGMCASERELGLGDNHNGIILLRQYGFSEAEYEALKPGQDAMHLLHQIDWRKRIRFPGTRASASHIHRTHGAFLGQDHGTSRSCLFIRHMRRCNPLYFCDISAIHRSFHSLCSHRLP